jgi:hypothetical protein
MCLAEKARSTCCLSSVQVIARSFSSESVVSSYRELIASSVPEARL